MLSKLNNFFKNTDKKLLICLMVGVGSLLIGFSGCDNKVQQEKPASQPQTDINLEEKLEKVLSKMDGVGRCDVIVTYETGGESVLQTDTVKSESIDETEGGLKKQSEISETTIVLGSGDGEHPTIVKTYMPQVRGVVVVAQGGGSSKIKKDIVSAVAALTGASAHNIGVYAAKTD